MEKSEVESKPEVKTQEELIKEHLGNTPTPKDRFAYVPGTRKAGSEITIGEALYIVSGNGNLLRMSEKSSSKKAHRQLVELKKEAINPNLKNRLELEERKRTEKMFKLEAKKRKKEQSRKEPEPIRKRIVTPIVRTPEELEKIAKETTEKELKVTRQLRKKAKLKKNNIRRMKRISKLINRGLIFK